MKKLCFAAALLVLFSCFGVTAFASDNETAGESDGFLPVGEGGLALGVGFSVGNTPYKDYDTQWMPVPLIYYEGKYAYIRGASAGVKLLNLPYLEVSAFIGYDGTEFDSKATSDWRVRQLKDRHSSAEVGAEARIATPVGMLYANAAGDISGHSDGFRGAAGWSNSLEWDDFSLSPSAGIYWSSERYNDYYYGVSEGESRKSGLNSYDAGGGVSPFIGLGFSYDISERWSAFVNTELVFLSDEVKDSPMVNKASTYNTTVGVTYGF